MPSTFDHFRQGLGPEELREDHGRLAGRIIEIEGNAVAPMLSEETADLRIAICPVADERNNTGALKRIFGGLCIDPALVVDFASETPVRCNVDEHWGAFVTGARELLFDAWLMGLRCPYASAFLRRGGSDVGIKNVVR